MPKKTWGQLKHENGEMYKHHLCGAWVHMPRDLSFETSQRKHLKTCPRRDG